MFVFELESLVLHGVSTLRGGEAGLRHGAGSETSQQVEAVGISMRRPSPGSRQVQKPAGRINRRVYDLADDAAFGAGRSRGPGGVLDCRSATRSTRATVLSRTVLACKWLSSASSRGMGVR